MLALLVTREVLFRVRRTTIEALYSSQTLLSCITVSCHVAKEVNVEWLSFVKNAQACPTQLCAETCCSGKSPSPWMSQVCFRFLAEREDDAFDDEGH